MELLDLLKERYSVRKYSDREIEEEKLQKVLEAGRLAPTAKNLQPQRVYVLKSKQALDKLRSLTAMTYNAPIVLMFACDENEQWVNPLEEGVTSGQQDVSIVAASMMLEAYEQGLGTVWCGYFPQTEVEKAFGLPENEKVLLIMPLGYPADDSVPSPRHADRYPLEKTVKVL